MTDEEQSLRLLTKRNIRISLEHYMHFYPNANEETLLTLWNDGRKVESDGLAREVIAEIKQEIAEMRSTMGRGTE